MHEPIDPNKAVDFLLANAGKYARAKAARHALEPVWAADTQRKIHAMGKWPKGIPYPHQQEQA